MRFMHYERYRRDGHGFSLVELVIVIMILGILMAVAVPALVTVVDNANVKATRATVRTIRDKIATYRMSNCEYPDTIQPEWFSNGRLPPNPFKPDHPILQIDSSGNKDKLHPIYKIIQDNPSHGQGFWYNPLNGAFRARVPYQKTDAATLDLYNEVNGADVTGYRDTT